MGAWHDRITADETLLIAALLVAGLGTVSSRTRLGAREIVLAVACGVALTWLTGLVASVGPSGMIERARFGLPHFYGSHEPGVAICAGDIVWAYFALDVAVWSPLALLALLALLLGRRNLRERGAFVRERARSARSS